MSVMSAAVKSQLQTCTESCECNLYEVRSTTAAEQALRVRKWLERRFHITLAIQQPFLLFINLITVPGPTDHLGSTLGPY